MTNSSFNKYRAAVEVLQRGRDALMNSLADEILDQADNFLESGYLFNEFLEMQGTRVHFLTLLLSQLEQASEIHEEQVAPRLAPTPPATSPRKRKSRTKKVSQKTTPENSTEDA